jgi:NitT/TauT family transport system substrate-binding protein
VLLNWFPEVEHGGFYAAEVHGYYADAGLNVKILPGGPESPVVQQVATGAVTFGVANADDVLFGRASEAPVVAVMAALQKSPRCLMVHESSGITDFSELRNMTIAMSSARAFSHYLRSKVPLDNVKIVPYPGNVTQFLLNKEYAQQAYVFAEPYVAKSKGGDPRVLMLADLGFNPYTSLLLTTEKVISEQPEVVRKLTEASRRGWAKYLEAPEETNRRIHELNPEMDLDVLAFGAEAIKPLVLDDAAQQKGIGTMTLERWQTLLDQLVESKQIKAGAVDVKQAFRETP